MKEIDFYLVDAFSDSAFGGNAAAVCLLDDWLPDAILQKMAQQHNQSETAFIIRQQSGFPCAGLPPVMRLIFAAMPRLPARMSFSVTLIILIVDFILIRFPVV